MTEAQDTALLSDLQHSANPLKLDAFYIKFNPDLVPEGKSEFLLHRLAHPNSYRASLGPRKHQVPIKVLEEAYLVVDILHGTVIKNRSGLERQDVLDRALDVAFDLQIYCSLDELVTAGIGKRDSYSGRWHLPASEPNLRPQACDPPHDWIVVRANAIGMLRLDGFPNGKVRISETTVCLECGSYGGRYAPGIETDSAREALDLYVQRFPENEDRLDRLPPSTQPTKVAHS